MTNEYEDNAGVTHAATEVINGVTYEVVYLTGDEAKNRNIVNERNKNTSGNYHYIMTENWDIPAGKGILDICGNSVILDLNGYTLSVAGWSESGNNAYLGLKVVTRFEITDSSPAQTGVAKCTVTGGPIFSGGSSGMKWVHSGGTLQYESHIHMDCVRVLLGGQRRVYEWGYSSNLPGAGTYEVAPWVRVTPLNGGVGASWSPTYFAISTTPYAVGLYNYVYGYAWELTAWQLTNLELPADKTYYLWGRDKDGRYESLNLRYIDGEWRNAA